MKLTRIFVTGLFISFLGTLPLGTLNVAAMQISVTDGLRAAFLFSLGALLVEILYVRLSLVAMNWVRRQKRLFKWLEWITLLIIVALAVSSFVAAGKPPGTGNIILSNKVNRFLLGVMMSAVNPVQIPFWFGWSTVLFTKKILQPRNDFYNIYMIGIGFGTFTGNAVFIFGGRLLVGYLGRHQQVLHWVIGCIFAITGLIQFYRMLRHKDAVHQLDHPGEVTQGLEQHIH